MRKGKSLEGSFTEDEGCLGLEVFDVGDSVTNGLNLLGIFFGDGDVEYLFEFHDELYGVEAVSTEVGGERSGGGYFVFVNGELVNDDSFYAICNF